MLFHRPNGITLEANTNVDEMFKHICERKPLYGEVFPKEFMSFIFFGKGCKTVSACAKASVWTLTTARGVSRKKSGRHEQREYGRVASKRRREEADAEHRAKNNRETRSQRSVIILMVLYFTIIFYNYTI